LAFCIYTVRPIQNPNYDHCVQTVSCITSKVSPCKSLIARQFRWCIFNPRSPLQTLPQQHVKLWQLLGVDVFTLVIVASVFWRVCCALFPKLPSFICSLLLQRQEWRPKDTKSLPQKEHIAKTRKSSIKLFRTIFSIDFIQLLLSKS